MEKKNNKLMILVIILLVAVGGVFFIGKTLLNKENKEEINEEINEEIKDDTTNKEEELYEKADFVGTYKVEYNEDVNDSPFDGATPSTITFNDDNTFVFVWNVCAGMMNTTGKYEIKNNKIVLSDLNDTEKELLDTNLEGSKTLEFAIISKDEIYLDSEERLACTFNGNKYGSFVKQN